MGQSRNNALNKELKFGRQVYESEDFVVYNTIVEAIVRELAIERIIVKQQKESTSDDAEDRYEVAQKGGDMYLSIVFIFSINF